MKDVSGLQVAANRGREQVDEKSGGVEGDDC